ncbi:MAG: Nudix family hydrolase [Gammaproteobacteria bacterium]|nr:Nudix family hydrolase [Gammaproteobacteria bacterium]NNF62148.1 Nudix family hydrolase [Gammaproteobacteria bacterium]NNM21839.1 Nudix family hydrolase [Gammaproteobacteria bacterium]
MPRHIEVIAGVITDASGRVLLAQRLPGSHMAGRWEFPGGKLEPGELEREGLVRELTEELAIEVTAASPLIGLRHEYPDRVVDLAIWRVDSYRGTPTGAEGQALCWAGVDSLHTIDLLEADLPIIDALRLPALQAITPPDLTDPQLLEQQVIDAVSRGAGMLQLRLPAATVAQLRELVGIAVAAARGCRVIVNGEPRTAAMLARDGGAAGIHVPSRFLPALEETGRPDELVLGVSCHDADELALAVRCGANYASLSPVRATLSHPDAVPIGWDHFEALARAANLPVYALGGVVRDDLDRARRAGAQGIAGITSFFR